MREWFKQKQAAPVFMKVAVRRFPKTASGGQAQEGGDKGVQADIGFLMDCDVPGLMKARRVTLVQAKKLKVVPSSGLWASGFPFHGKELAQLEKLIGLSEHAHYLFFLHPDTGSPALFLTARAVRDSCRSGTLSTVPLNLVRNSCKEAAEFLLHDIIGLWTGDDDAILLKNSQDGEGVYQAPRILVEIKVSSDHDQHQ